jgi:coenzyme PQQ precursor peptide PqqA
MPAPETAVKGEKMNETWITPDHEEIPVAAECTAYAGAK